MSDNDDLADALHAPRLPRLADAHCALSRAHHQEPLSPGRSSANSSSSWSAASATRAISRARTRLATLGFAQALDRFDWNHPRAIDREPLRASARHPRLHRAWRKRTPARTERRRQDHARPEPRLRGPATRLFRPLHQPGRRSHRPAQTRILARARTAPAPRYLSPAHLDPRRAWLPALRRPLRRPPLQHRLLVGTNPSPPSSPPIWRTNSGAPSFHGAACVVALVDRFVQHCHVIDIDADSWRDKERLERNGRPPRSRSADPCAV